MTAKHLLSAERIPVICEPSDREHRKRDGFVSMLAALFVQAADEHVGKDGQARVSGRSLVKTSGNRPCRAFIIAETDGHPDTGGVGGIGKEHAVSSAVA